MGKLRREEICGPGCITKLNRALSRIEYERDRGFLARAIELLRDHGHDAAVELLLAQGGVMMLLRERVHVRRMLRKLRCEGRAGEDCARVGVYVYVEELGITEELSALEEIESAEDSAATKL